MITDSPPSRISTVRRFVCDLAHVSGRKGVFAAIFMVLGAIFEGLGLAMVVPLLGVVTSSEPDKMHVAVFQSFTGIGLSSPFARLSVLMGIFAGLLVLRGIVLSVRGVLLAEVQIGFVEVLRLRITKALVAARWDHIAHLRHARVTHLMSGDIQRVSSGAGALLLGTAALAMLIVQGVLAVILQPGFALLSLALLAFGAVSMIPILRRTQNLGGYVTNVNLKLLDDTTQFLGGLKIAVSQNQQASYLAKFTSTLRQLSQRQVSSVRLQVNNQVAMATMSALLGAGLVLAGFSLFHLSAPILMTLLLIFVRMSGPASQIQQSAQQVAHALSAYEKVCELGDELTAARSESVTGSALVLPEGPVVFDRVSFAHNREGVGGVRDLNLTIEPGEFLGIGGASGAGKTTFADLLAGLLPPQSGTITVGGAVLSEATLASWRNAIAYVSQDPFLFHDTVRGNLSWATAATEEQMWRALALAGADGIVRRLPADLDTVVGERGSLLSGGERQRIALARALLRRPRLLVLDEATNAIDVAGERAILNRLVSLRPRPAIVMIAHRPESHAVCRRVLVLDNGRLQMPA